MLVNHGEKEYEVITLVFEDQTFIRIIDSHVFFDLTEGAYVTIDNNNFSEYVGQSFMTYQVNNTGYSSKKLVSATSNKEITSAYAIVTDTHYSCITDNMVTATPTIPGLYLLISSYLDENLQFDVDRFSKDVEEYGTYEYGMFEEYLSYEQFVQLCAPFYKIAEAKDYMSYKELQTFFETTTFFGNSNRQTQLSESEEKKKHDRFIVKLEDSVMHFRLCDMDTLCFQQKNFSFSSKSNYK